jgi:hypothetical protein
MSNPHDVPAFPLHTAKWHEYVNDEGYVDHDFTMGMTLRDYFAGQVAIGAMSAYWNGDRITDPTFKDIAQQAYGIAHAMLKARDAD